MTLDSLEKFARSIEKYGITNDSVYLARAVLLLLPVVRAAEYWHGWGGTDDSESLEDAATKLFDAIDSLRTALNPETRGEGL